MSSVAHRALPRSHVRRRLRTLSWPGLLVTAALGGLAVLVAGRWWQRADALPLSWQLPPVEALLLLPSAPVLALLALRAARVVRNDASAGQPLGPATSRWAAAWALVTAGWVLSTVTNLYGTGLRGLLGADNLLEVAASSDVTGPRLTVLWVALLIALFGRRLVGRRESLALVALAGVAVLAAVPATGAAHGHGDGSHPLVQIAFAAQVLAFVTWVGSAVAVVHLRPSFPRRRDDLGRLGHLFSAATLVLGASTVLAGSLRPVAPSEAGVAVVQLVALGVVVVVGYRQRRRSTDVVGSGPSWLLAALVLGELVVLGAVLALGGLLPLF